MKFNPNRSGKYPAYHDPERVPMLILLVGLMIGLVIFLWWALTP